MEDVRPEVVGQVSAAAAVSESCSSRTSTKMMVHLLLQTGGLAVFVAGVQAGVGGLQWVVVD